MQKAPKYAAGPTSAHSRRRRARAAIGTTAVALLLVVAGCGGDDGGGGSSAPEPTGDQANDQGLLDGRELYAANCATCHALDGGGGQGPKLSDGDVAERYPDIADQIDVITNGRGSMPAWGGELSASEIENVARYEREVL
ncbi:MAG: cytochrome c [Acidimicrobiia bacterium]